MTASAAFAYTLVGNSRPLASIIMLLRSQKRDSMELGNRGNVLTALKGERMELHLKEALPAREISRLMGVHSGAGGTGSGKDGGREDEAERKRGSFAEGVSLEGEYAFTKGIEAFCKVAVREGRYKGTYLYNLKDQMTMRVRKAVESSGKIRVLTIGASEMGRIRKEWEKVGAGKIEIGEELKVKGRLDRGEGARLEEMLENVVIHPDKVVIAGPGNSLMAHEGGGARAGVVKRMVTMRVDKEGKVEGLDSRFHLLEPGRLTMCERSVVAQVLCGLVRKVRDLWPLVEVYYLGILPRHVTKCCADRRHMSEVDPQVINRGRQDLEDDIRDELRRAGEGVVCVGWSEAIGLESEPNLEDIIRFGVVGEDGVHLSAKVCGKVAGLLYRRLASREMEGMDKKRPRTMSY